jgi:drug/metabolite transporter (DMT)-like permease
MLNVNIKKTILFSHYKAEFFLFLATILWGGTFPVIKVGLEWIDPYFLIFLRFLIAFLILNIVLIIKRNILKTYLLKYRILINGMILGLIGFFSYLTQTYGLQYTTPSRSAFITQTLIIFVYLFQFIFLKKVVLRNQWLSLIIIILGSYILFFGFRFNDIFSSNTLKGDIYTLFCAIGFALYIVLIDQIKKDELLSIIYIHFLVIVILSFIWIYNYSITLMNLNLISIGAIFYLSIPATLITTLILFYFQPKVTPVKASIIYALEPVFATIFSILFLKSIYTLQDFLGSSLIFLGSIIGEINTLKFNKNSINKVK